MRFSLGSALLVVGMAAGYLTGQRALDNAGLLAATDGSKWMQAAVLKKDPYAIYAYGHFREVGSLPPGRDARLFTRTVDDEGNALRSSCSYMIEGPAPAARWWAITAAAPGGRGSSSFNAADAILTSDDQLELAVSRTALPGNWLALGDIGDFALSIALNGPSPETADTTGSLPTVKKVACQ